MLDLKDVYKASTEEIAYQNLEKLQEKWEAKYALAVKPWIVNWDNIKTFYVKGGIRNHRQPAYLLTTDLNASTEFLLQSYLDRWQIEVNFREEKSILGVGEAQVWNEKSVEKQPGFRVACYSALLLSNASNASFG